MRDPSKRAVLRDWRPAADSDRSRRLKARYHTGAGLATGRHSSTGSSTATCGMHSRPEGAALRPFGDATYACAGSRAPSLQLCRVGHTMGSRETECTMVEHWTWLEMREGARSGCQELPDALLKPRRSRDGDHSQDGRCQMFCRAARDRYGANGEAPGLSTRGLMRALVAGACYVAIHEILAARLRRQWRLPKVRRPSRR
jgi:hypothetical protein